MKKLRSLLRLLRTCEEDKAIVFALLDAKAELRSLLRTGSRVWQVYQTDPNGYFELESGTQPCFTSAQKALAYAKREAQDCCKDDDAYRVERFDFTEGTGKNKQRYRGYSVLDVDDTTVSDWGIGEVVLDLPVSE